MFRTPFTSAALALIVSVGGLTAEEPPAKDYQKVADEKEWAPPKVDLLTCLASELSGYQVELVREKGNRSWTFRVSDGDKEVYSWKGHSASVFFEREGILYHADFSPHSTGCAVVAFDLSKKKQLWNVSLKGIGPVAHFAYSNRTVMEPLDATTLVVHGSESFGKYIEILDLKTGKTVGHKVFKEAKPKK